MARSDCVKKKKKKETKSQKPRPKITAYEDKYPWYEIGDGAKAYNQAIHVRYLHGRDNQRLYVQRPIAHASADATREEEQLVNSLITLPLALTSPRGVSIWLPFSQWDNSFEKATTRRMLKKK